MELQHLNVKFLVEAPESVNLQPYVRVFNSWIQAGSADELLIDVADYRHVPEGPGVILIGHEANYSLDNTGGRLGLLYNRKAAVPGSNGDRLRQAVRAALLAAQRLAEAEPSLRIRPELVQVTVNDRLLAPNTAETLDAVRPELEAFFDALYGGAPYTVENNPELRERFNVTVAAQGRFEVAGLLQALTAAEAA